METQKSLAPVATIDCLSNMYFIMLTGVELLTLTHVNSYQKGT